MSTAKTVAKNAVYLFSADIIGRVFSFLLIILIARKLGDFGLGQYSFAFSFVGLFSILADMGISTYLIREIAKDKKKVDEYYSHALVLKLILGLITFIIPLIVLVVQAIIFKKEVFTETFYLVFLSSLLTDTLFILFF